MGGLTLESVTNAHLNWYLGVFVRQKMCCLFSLRFVVIWLEVIENSVQICLCLLFWVSSVRFYVVALPFFYHVYLASLRAFVRASVAVYNSSLVLLWAIFVFLSAKHRRDPCHQHPWYWKIVPDFEAYPSTGAPSIHLSPHARTWRDEYVCPVACLFSSQLIANGVAWLSL